MIFEIFVIDVLAFTGFTAALVHAFRLYLRTRFTSAVGMVHLIAMASGMVWSASQLLANFDPGFEVIAPWFFAFTVSMLTGLIIIRAT